MLGDDDDAAPPFKAETPPGSQINDLAKGSLVVYMLCTSRPHEQQQK